MKGDIRLLVQKRSDELDRLLARYAELTGKAIPELLNSTAVRFAGRAMRATPPDENRSVISPEALKRSPREFRDPKGKRASRWRLRWTTAHGKWVKWADSPEGFGEYLDIMNRGAARYAWAGALVGLGKPLPRVVPASFRYAGKAQTLAQKLSAGVPATLGEPVAEVRNSGSYVALEAMNAGLRIANHGLAQGIKRLEEELAHGLQ